ncbi:hypothetical protein OHC33_003787 [Knufia fluminis]|uniref:Uncharacterized protein n=1 Tax=Knufia fluminis TaxID=191047 RepID=A0AAN8F2E1_9EURO|nr:hypothetical protein OHC33_003787 [Knufia fluminis]
MSPAIEALQDIANDISAGFEVLLERLDAQRRTEIDLRQQLAKAAERYQSDDSENPSDGALSDWQDEIVKQLSYLPWKEYNLNPDLVPEIVKAKDAIEKLRGNMAGVTARKCPVAHNIKPAEDGTVSVSTPRKCPVAHKSTPPPTYQEMEKDFTTQGKPSSLECPFAKMTKTGGISDIAESIDPIAAEFHADTLSAQSLDAARGCGKCPIRFLDKHSPEEVAQYFENHKHELPRSHEICVKRYQQNENSIRQLDAKYGNIVSMIQGLGNKHKQYLPEGEQAALSGSDRKSTAAVEKWAENVDGSSSMVDEVALDGEAEREPRASHFDKPLRDVRVGESPTRPWGIHVPADRSKAPSAASLPRRSVVPTAKLDAETSQTKPVVDGVTTGAASTRASASQATSKRSRSRRPNQIIFNGPVFLGYSPEQAAQFLNQIGTRHGT